jgi:predicted MFS family arabinose efflux permease
MLVSLVGYLLFAAIHHPLAFYASALIIGLGNGHMYPAYQNMFINLATSHQRGTANSTLLTSWDSGMGLGVLFGGIFAEAVNYHASFWMMWIANLIGVLTFFLLARHHYQIHCKE